MKLNKSQFLLGMATLGVLSASPLFTSSASAVSFGSVGAPTSGTVNGVTFSNFSTTSTDASWLSYFLDGTATPFGAQLGIAANATAATAGTYDLSYTVTSTLPFDSISLNQNAFSTISVKNVSTTPGGSNITGFPLTTTNGGVTGSVANLTTLYVTDTITVSSGGFVTSVSNTFSTAVPEPLTILGAMTAAGFGIGFKRKSIKAGQKESQKV
jgi:hypothetical protein